MKRAIRAKNLSAACLGMMFLCLPLSGYAAIEWKFHSNSLDLCTSGCASTYTQTKVFKADPSGDAGPSVSVTAWADTGNGNQYEQGDVGGPWSGLGVRNAAYTGGDPGEGSNPEHAMDNDGFFDLLRFDFGNAIRLTKIMLGWYEDDSDISVLRYTGPGTAGSIDGKTPSDLVNDSWELVGHYSNVHDQPNDTQDISGDTIGDYSNSWIIAAFNPAFDYENWSKGNDHVKVKLLAGKERRPPKVPEPSSLLLLLFGLPLLRRRLQSDGLSA